MCVSASEVCVCSGHIWSGYYSDVIGVQITVFDRYSYCYIEAGFNRLFVPILDLFGLDHIQKVAVSFINRFLAASEDL